MSNIDAADQKLPPRTKRCLHLGDACVALLLIGPLVVIHWRGTWALMDRCPDWFSPWRSTIAGIGLCTIIAMLRETLYTTVSAKKGKRGLAERVTTVMFTKVYAFVFSIVCQMQWRGSWALLDHHFGE